MVALLIALAFAADLPTGQIVGEVRCDADPAQSYALYLPRAYTSDRAWPVILAFDPGGRGRVPVERYQAAAERYGFIVAGSNDSRNGAADIGRAVSAMSNDVLSRFRVDAKRLYTAGMSGGARVALNVALGSNGRVAGAVASSAGYPDGRPRKTLNFVLFATAGTEDFNHLELRQIDRALTSPHRLAVFEGGHVWLSSDLAIEAVEWLEIQAMKSGIRPRDAAEIDAIFAKRSASIDPARADKDTFLALQAIADDFQGLKDVSAFAARAAELGRDRNIRAAMKKDRDDDALELRMLEEVRLAEAKLTSTEDHHAAIEELRRRWKRLADAARAAEDSPERRLARRVLGQLSASAMTTDADYLKIISEYRPARR